MSKQSRLTGLGRLRQLHDVSAAIGEEMAAERERFDRMADPSSKAQAIAVPQLFQTPTDLAKRLVELADIQPDQHVLEPSAGTGALIGAMRQFPIIGRLVAVEINVALCVSLQARFPNAEITCADFLECDPQEIGTFDRIIMNPPFTRGADVEHIRHATSFLKPNGRLVAICAGNRERHFSDCWEWIPLPSGSFKESGTNVESAIVVMDAS